MTGDGPRYPVLAISPGDSFFVTDRLCDSCTLAALNNGYFDDLFYLDADGFRWQVLDVTLRRPITMLDRLPGRRVPVALTLSEPTVADLESCITVLCDLLDSDPDDLYQHLRHDELKARFRSAASARELVSIARNS